MGGDFRRLVRRILSLGRGRLFALALLSVAAALAEGAGIMLLVPLLDVLGVTGSRRMVEGLGALLGPLASLEGALALYALLAGAAALVIRTRAIAATRLRLRFVDDLRQELHAAVLGMEWTAFQRLRAADVTHVIMGEVGRAGLAVDTLASLLAAGITIPVLLGVAFGLSPAMTLATLGAAAVVALLSRPLDRRHALLGRALGEAHRGLNADLTDDLSGLRVVKSFAAEDGRAALFASRLGDLRARQLDHAATMATGGAVVRAAAAVSAALAVAVAVRGFGMGVADALVFVLAFGRLMMAGLRLQEQWRRLLNALPGHAAAETLLDRCQAAAEPPASAEAPALAREIRLEGVAARHGGAEAPALRGIDAVIPAGRTTAIVGPSGAGKSTLADLLLGLLEPEQGRLLADGVPVAGADRTAWRRSVGYVPQDAFLFHDTIRANLLLAAPHADEPGLWRALEDAAVADVVRNLPQGLDTVVGDRGARLSGGERQRVALARALLRRPALLILDEATSALDAGTEERVAETLRRLRGAATLIVVAHRPGTVRGADQVLVLEAGGLVASGGWEEVRASAGGRLAALGMAG
ncbi:ABC transporter ATP-binding protein [Azospirillum sp. SYSU D00513]|uniref:ABC transporter ATP-binding protein n=1 Tax=Azospirillum sp. SYSU D00513 TaxID=2812561 RepID=UPI001A95A82C|nr:ABC transporter ATP-binding protein [Azospirillum sp. SYSU D00513]